jgi:sulfide:quinone oxidoreductase
VCVGDRAYDAAFVHLVPPYRTPEVVRRSGLAADVPGDLVDNDPRTFRHRRFADVWALGDCATTLNLHSGAALREQAPVLADNLREARADATLHEDAGYSAAPVTVSQRRLCFAEFGADGSRQGSLPYVDLFRPRRSTWLFDRYVLPRIYWRGILRGRL